MTDAEKVISAEQLDAIPFDEWVDWEFNFLKHGYVYRPNRGVINSYIYEKLSDQKKQEFVFDPALQRYVRRIIAENSGG